ncbi:tetratricopeptide repeat-containing sensor histidine kinase [Chitinophaga vietnamensis]|uniref:tetratricopeptide repeat-containing sensor histidine kinase n=1 Tax=Chitinophaga vietnamensis TaxID=2593957 RepID=UPI001375C347|nr:tetratricopeptide repeat-containing sensor histidine kinase [Chitinophaga vietnamensis]
MLNIILLCTLTGILMAQAPVKEAYMAKVNRLRNAGAFDSALIVLQEYLDTSLAHHDSLGIGNAYNGMGIVKDRQGKLEEALKYYFKGLGIYEKTHNDAKTGGALKNIGNVYRSLHDYSQALAFLSHALELQKQRHDSASIGNVLNDIGLVYMDKNSNDSALWYFDHVIHEYNSYIRDEVKALALNNAATANTALKHYDQAISLYQASLALMQKREDQYGIALVYDNMGLLYFRSDRPQEAVKHYELCVKIAREIAANHLLQDAYVNLGNIYASLHNYGKAYTYIDKAYAMKDTIYQEQLTKSYAEMETRYQNEKKQREIIQLQQDNRINSLRLESQRRTRYFLLGGIALLAIIAVTLYRSYRIKRNANDELNLLNRQLKEANASKTKLFSIISHDLRSPVSSLFSFLALKRRQKEQLLPADQDTFDKELTQSAERLLDAMEDLLIWSKSQMDTFKPAPVLLNAAELLEEIVTLHHHMATARHVRLSAAASPGMEVMTDENFLKIILRNLVSNAIKFTPEEGTVRLSARQEAGKNIFIVQDSGLGIAEEELAHIFDWNSIRSDSSGLGLKLAKEFTEKLGGVIVVSSALHAGTTFTITLPA